MPKLFEEDLIGAKIMEAFLGPHSMWRTAGGIARGCHQLRRMTEAAR